MRAQVDNYEPRLFGWQISSFYDLKPTDQAIYNALVTASDELWWIHGGRLQFPTPGESTEPWPTVPELDEQYALPPFVRDLAWQQQGKVEWQRIAAFSFEGSTVYYGAGGGVPGQGAYLLVLSHVHKGRKLRGRRADVAAPGSERPGADDDQDGLADRQRLEGDHPVQRRHGSGTVEGSLTMRGCFERGPSAAPAAALRARGARRRRAS